MIDRLVAFELVGDALWEDHSVSEDENYGSFAFSFRLPSDPAIMHEYLEEAPEQFGSVLEALTFFARFLQNEIINNWQITDGQKVVDYLERLAADPRRTDVPPVYVALAVQLEIADRQ